MTLGEKIKNARSLRGLSQIEVANLMGVSLPTYQAVEHDRGNTVISNIKKVCEVLDIRHCIGSDILNEI